jgi:aflatoxin B1 aldehyde reductase
MLFREPENDILPILHKYDISFMAYSPLAGGFLTGLLTKGIDLEGTRFEKGNKTGDWYKRTYDKAAMHSTVTELQKQCQRHGLRITEVALRWLYYHSRLTERDGIILGASSEKQIRQNMEDISNGPLPDKILTLVGVIFD